MRAAVDEPGHALARQQLAALLEALAFDADSATTLACSACTSARRSAMRAALAWKASDRGFSDDFSAGTT
jgi:hypothetical protein